MTVIVPLLGEHFEHRELFVVVEAAAFAVGAKREVSGKAGFAEFAEVEPEAVQVDFVISERCDHRSEHSGQLLRMDRHFTNIPASGWMVA